MKILFLASITVLLCSCQTTSEKVQQDLEQITDQDASNLLQKWEKAMIDKDSTLMGEVLHPEYQYSGSPDGSTADRQAMMIWVATDPGQLISQTFFDMDIKIYGNMAVVRGWEVMLNASAEGDTTSTKLRFTDVYLKEDGVTRALSTHSSPMD